MYTSILLSLLACLIVLSIFIIFVWYTNPAPLIKFLLRLPLYLSGMRVHYVDVDDLRVCYAERGKYQPGTSSLIFIHGFSASKDMWPQVIKRLPKDLHLVVVDLPGHGGTSEPVSDDDLSVVAMTKKIHQFIHTVGFADQPFHLTGTSLGGAIAALYSAFYPEEVSLLTLVCPAMRTPVETEFMSEVRNGRCSLLPNTENELQEMLDLCFYHKQRFNKQVLKGILQLRLLKTPFYTRLFNAIQDIDGAHDQFIQDILKINIPTQVIWGKHDNLIDPSGAELLKEHLPNCYGVEMFDKCGHSVIMDRPGLFTKHLLKFRADCKEDCLFTKTQ